MKHLPEYEDLAERDEVWRTFDGDAFVAIAAGISVLSEEHYCAGWDVGCEWDLLRIVESGEPTPSWPIAAEDIAAFRAHRERAAGGWVAWRSDADGLGATDFASWGPYSLTADKLVAARGDR